MSLVPNSNVTGYLLQDIKLVNLLIPRSVLMLDLTGIASSTHAFGSGYGLIPAKD